MLAFAVVQVMVEHGVDALAKFIDNRRVKPVKAGV